MKKIILNLQNKYIIEFIRKDKDITFNQYQYIFYINFLDIVMGTTITSIECSEENFYNTIENLNYFIYGFRDNIDCKFTTSFDNNYICIINNICNDKSNYINNDLNIFNMNILKVDKYRLYNYGSIISVINIDISENELISIIQNMYNLVRDIPYLDLLHYEFISTMEP